jgi:hypothetical protein
MPGKLKSSARPTTILHHGSLPMICIACYIKLQVPVLHHQLVPAIGSPNERGYSCYFHNVMAG